MGCRFVFKCKVVARSGDRGEAAPGSARFKAALLKATPTKHTMMLACEATGTIDEIKG